MGSRDAMRMKMPSIYNRYLLGIILLVLIIGNLLDVLLLERRPDILSIVNTAAFIILFIVSIRRKT